MSTTLDIVCPSCGRTLRIAAEHAGKQVRCPACQQVSAAPGPPGEPLSDIPLPATAEEDLARWHVRTPEGVVYGPIRWNELLGWVSEGRVAADCELASSAEGPWQSAGAILPVLNAAQPPESSASSLPLGPVPSHAPANSLTNGASPFAVGTQGAPRQMTPHLTPHRGALVLVFGVLGIVVGCPVFSALAWIIGSRDLREMRTGRMDRQGEGITMIGMILGMIISIFWLVIGFLTMSVALIAIAARF